MRASLAVVCLAFATACEAPPANAPPPSAPAPAAAVAPRATITLLYTTDEHGWILPTLEDGRVEGGAAELLARWIAEDGHCPGAMPAWTPPEGAGKPAFLPIEAPSAGCEAPSTLLLSGGDSWTGPAVSSFFQGAPMALAMARMGYAASAFGNHELDFTRESFVKNRAAGGFPYLAANLHVEDPALRDTMALPSFAVFERRGVKIAVVGLATDTTLTTAKASNFAGITFEAEEAALVRAVPEAWAAKPDAVVLIAHECPDKLGPIVERHPEWNLSFVGGGHCHKTIRAVIGGVPVVAPGWRLRTYARVKMTIDGARPPGARVLSVEPEVITMRGPPGGPADEAIARVGRAYQQATEMALGEPIGFTATGLEQKSPQLWALVAGAWRDRFKADVAIANEGGLRQAIPKGRITKGTIHSVMPFDNRIFLVDLTGAQLLDVLAVGEVRASGVSRDARGKWRDSAGKSLDLARRYRVATIDFLYFGGSGCPFQEHDAEPEDTGVDWREPVIAWLRAQHSSEKAPIEARLP